MKFDFKEVLENIITNAHMVLKNTFRQFDTNEPLISEEVQEILAHPKDRKIFLDALQNLRDMEEGQPITIQLSFGEMTIQNRNGPTIMN